MIRAYFNILTPSPNPAGKTLLKLVEYPGFNNSIPISCPVPKAGEVAEWLKAPVSKTGIPFSGIVGSNPTLSVFWRRVSEGLA